MSSTYTFFQHAPKVELHIHLDGAFDMDLLFEIGKRDIETLPETVFAPWNGKDIVVREAIRACKTKEEFSKLVCLGPEDVVAKRIETGSAGAGLECMLDCFAVFTPIVQGKCDVVEEMAFRVCTRQHLENVMYTELRYNPHLLALEGSSLPDARSVVKAVTAGIARGKALYGIEMNQILCCINLMPQASAEVAELAIEYKSQGVVAVDVAAGEGHFDDPELHKAHVAACVTAKKAGLHVTVHGAENGAANNLCCAVREYRAERVGHAYAIAGDAQVYQFAKDTNTHLETCPTSSICTEAVSLPIVNPEAKNVLDRLDWTAHPIKKFIEDGMSVSISTDDPTVFLAHLTGELTILSERFGLDARDAGLKVTMHAIDRCWASEEAKDQYRSKAKTYYGQSGSPSTEAPPSSEASISEE